MVFPLTWFQCYQNKGFLYQSCPFSRTKYIKGDPFLLIHFFSMTLVQKAMAGIDIY